MKSRVVDSAPLIFLHKIGRLNILKIGVEKIFIPEEVLQEIREKPDILYKAITSGKLNWMEICKIKNKTIYKFLIDLGKGERAVISQALELKTEDIVMDDMDARRKARLFGLKPVGTLGLLLLGKKISKIKSLKKEINKLEKAGFWLSPELKKRFLKEAGEK